MYRKMIISDSYLRADADFMGLSQRVRLKSKKKMDGREREDSCQRKWLILVYSLCSSLLVLILPVQRYFFFRHTLCWLFCSICLSFYLFLSLFTIVLYSRLQTHASIYYSNIKMMLCIYQHINTHIISNITSQSIFLFMSIFFISFYSLWLLVMIGQWMVYVFIYNILL